MKLKSLGRLVRHDMFVLIISVGSIGRLASSVQHPLGAICRASVMPEFHFLGPGLVVLWAAACWDTGLIRVVMPRLVVETAAPSSNASRLQHLLETRALVKADVRVLLRARLKGKLR